MVDLGDIVGVALKSDHRKSLCRAVIYKLTDQTVSVAVDELNSEEITADERTYCLVKLVNDITYRRYEKSVSFIYWWYDLIAFIHCYQCAQSLGRI